MKKQLAFCLIAGGAISGLFVACSQSGSTGTNPVVDMAVGDTSVAATYTVGGSVAGVAGSSLVLSLNGTEDLPVSAAGPFTFQTKLLAASQYSVTVKTQPQNQTCTVMSGSGTVAAANVSSVSVVCSINAYKVGGTVSGLTGNLVLQNNSGDDLTVSASGQFQFITPVATGASYAVTVKTQPANLFCSVSAGTGMIAGSAVSTVAVSCVTPTSCQDWLTKLPTAKDGAYAISPDGTTPYQVYCDMTNDGGGWTMVMRFKDDGVLGYASTYWTDTNTFNEDAGGSVDPTLNANAKTMAFVNLPFATLRGCKGAPGPGLCFQQNLNANQSLQQVFTGNFITNGPTRDVFVGLWGDDSSQLNCNGSGVNNYKDYSGPGTYSGARFGLIGNNEPDCVTTDSAWGFGVFGCSSMNNTCGAGAQFWQSGACGRSCTQGTLWVK